MKSRTSACRARGLCMLLLTCCSLRSVAGVHWWINRDKPDCVSAWLPAEQWDVCVKTLFKQGVHRVDARSVPLILQLGTSAMTVPQGSGWRELRPRMDVSITAPDGTQVYKKDAILDTGQLSFTAHGSRGPWKLCMGLSKSGHYFSSALVSVAYFTVNHKLLLGTALEVANSSRIALESDMHTKAPEGIREKWASQLDIAELRRAMWDVEHFIFAVHREVQHTSHMIRSLKERTQRGRRHALRWSLLLNSMLVTACTAQVAAIRFLFREKRTRSRQVLY